MLDYATYLNPCRSAASFQKASMLPHAVPDSNSDSENKQLKHFDPSKHESWDEHNRKGSGAKGCLEEDQNQKPNPNPNPFLSRITMVGMATTEAGPMSKATLKNTMDDLTKELESMDQGNMVNGFSEDNYDNERDPLFQYEHCSKSVCARNQFDTSHELGSLVRVLF